MTRISTFLLFIFAVSAGLAQTYDAGQMSRQQKGSARTVSNLFREAQSKRGAALQTKLTNIIQEVLASEESINSYIVDNKSKRGAIVYASAAGGVDDGKTIRLIFGGALKTECEGGGPKYKTIQEWLLPNALAQQVAANTAQRLSGVGDTMAVDYKVGSDGAQVILYPPGKTSVSEPVLAESVSLR